MEPIFIWAIFLLPLVIGLYYYRDLTKKGKKKNARVVLFIAILPMICLGMLLWWLSGVKITPY
jgi:hypothetical protein